MTWPNRLTRSACALLAVSWFYILLLPGCNRAMSEEPPGNPASAEPTPDSGVLHTLTALNIRDAHLQTLLDGLQRPRAFEFLDPRRLLITQMDGQLLLFDLDNRQRTVIANVPVVASEHEQTGLIDVAIHPDFAKNSLIYLSYVVRDPNAPNYYRTDVARARLVGAGLEDVSVILRAEPFGWAPSNFGGALEFDAEGKLYVSIGDRGEHELAQRGDRLEAKVLRLNDDGSVPADNPFVDDPQVDDRIYAIGLRNAQGLYFDHDTGLLFETEHGPLGGDEVNIVAAGANYGWPVITYGNNYNTLSMGEGTHKEGMQQPIFYYLPSEAISPVVRYRGAMFKEWDGDLLVGALKGEHVSKLDMDGTVVRSEYPILRELGGRVRDIKVASDGSIYFLVQTGRLYRLYRDPPGTVDAPPVDPAEIYAMVCSGCHDNGSYGAPNPAIAADWEKVLAQPREQIYTNMFNGKGDMPARGLCYICSDKHLRQTVDLLLQRAEAAL
jgi:glucose/arabinose dehydrogenase/cytochrome c5